MGALLEICGFCAQSFMWKHFDGEQTQYTGLRGILAKTPNAHDGFCVEWQIFLAYILIYERKLVQTLMSSIRCSPFRVRLCVPRVFQKVTVDTPPLSTLSPNYGRCVVMQTFRQQKKDARFMTNRKCSSNWVRRNFAAKCVTFMLDS